MAAAKAKEISMAEKIKKWRKMKFQRSENDQSLRHTWSLKEKQKLLEALREFGCDDVDKLQKAVGTRTREQIEHFIIRRKEAAKRKADNAAVDAPIDIFLTRASKAISQKCDYSIALVEALSRCAEKSLPKYTEVYEYLQRLLKNESTADLGPEASVIILRLLKDVAILLKTVSLNQLQQAITNSEIDLDLVDASDAFYTTGPFASIGPSLNPLNISSNVLQHVFQVLN